MPPEPRRGDRVVVGMSGGVDSSVAAALLVEAGLDVIGVAMRLWDNAGDSGCCSLDDFLDARMVAARLGIAFYVMDFRDVFTRVVVDPFVAEYVAGRTPNPCVRCNQFVKFAAFTTRARELGARWVATGHYARVRHDPGTGAAQLWAAADSAKDQSYFLFAIGTDTLNDVLFPLGELTKHAVRAKAQALGLRVAAKPESQEVCFAPAGNYAAFVEARVPQAMAPGDIVDERGVVVGAHQGVHRFTIGQRRGIGISGGPPRYVTRIDAVRRTVHVGGRTATLAGGVRVAGARWLGSRPAPGSRLLIKIRSRFDPAEVVLDAVSNDGFVAVAARGLPAVTPGQAAVLYEGGRVVGGGWIECGMP